MLMIVGYIKESQWNFKTWYQTLLFKDTLKACDNLQNKQQKYMK